MAVTSEGHTGLLTGRQTYRKVTLIFGTCIYF